MQQIKEAVALKQKMRTKTTNGGYIAFEQEDLF